MSADGPSVDALIKARSKPDFLQDMSTDKIVAVLMRLAMENGVLRDRIARQEAILLASGVISQEQLDEYAPSEAARHASNTANAELIRAIVADLT